MSTPSELATLTGLPSTAGSPSSSAWWTSTRCSTPSCGAASPTPRAFCITYTIRAASVASAWSKPVTSRAFIRSTGSGYWRTEPYT